MPPKKKARTKSRNDEELEKLVKWLTRDQLEGFVTAAVQNGTLPVNNLWDCVPERAVLEIRKPSAPVSIGDDRVGTGYFDQLDQNIMREILSYCPLLTKITCVTSVCKAWRAYKTIPGLFIDLSERLGTSRGESIYTRTAFLDALLDFVPDEAAVEAVRMATSKSDDHNLCNAIFKRLGALKTTLEKQGNTFQLRSIVLQGEKLSPTVIKRLCASGICSSLTSLVFDDVYGSKKLHKEDAIPNLLKLCPNLEELTFPASLMDERNLAFHISALSTARGGAPPLLKKLDLSDNVGWRGRNAISWSILSKIGAQLPYLEVFKLPEIRSDTPTQMHPSAPGFTEAQPPLSQFLSEPFAPMPNLKVFQVGRIIPRYDFIHELTPRYVTTPYLTRIITRLMDAAPALETFSFGHGKHGHVSKKKLRSGNLIVPPLPTFELHALPMPPTLKNLTLQYVSVDPAEFAGLDIQHFDNIRFLYCGPAVMNTIEMLHQQVPHFKLTSSENGQEIAAKLSRVG